MGTFISTYFLVLRIKKEVRPIGIGLHKLEFKEFFES